MVTSVRDAGGSTAVGSEGEPVMVFSSDTHVGPRLKEDLRPYCPKQYLSDYDKFLASDAADPDLERVSFGAQSPEWLNGRERNMLTAGHYDPHARMRDFDRDGVVGGVIFHSSLNGQAFPLDNMQLCNGVGTSARDKELQGVGRSVYNRWLVDFCSVEPERNIGLVQLPLWDIDASIKELEWAAEQGLGGVNFPAPGNPGMRQPFEPDFDRFFAAAASLDMTLMTHLGTAGQRIMDPTADLDAAQRFMMVDMVDWGLRTISMLTLFGVFERHPNLKLIITELPGRYFGDLGEKLDSAYRAGRRSKEDAVAAPFFREYHLPRLPSEYMATNVWVGASFMSRQEAVNAIEIGSEDRFCWGSDYPHPEGTFTYAEDPQEYPMTRLSLAHTFHDLPVEKVRSMVGENLLNAYPRADAAALSKVANRLGVTAREITTAPDLREYAYVSSLGTRAFRKHGIWD